MKKIAILGGGIAGFGAAHHLQNSNLESAIYEKQNYHGGHAASFHSDGFIFDNGPHISFTKIDRIKELFAQSVNNQYESFVAGVNNYWNGHWVKHPAQVNLHGLPKEMIVKIISEFIEAKYDSVNEINNYKDWLYDGFGKTFSENFPMRYGKKFHTTDAEKMSTDWVGPRVYKPEITEVLSGALSSKTHDVHYVSDFRYPTNGGFVSYFNTFLSKTNLKLNHEVIEIDAKKRQISFANNSIVEYDGIVSSIPLPELIPLIKNAPQNVLKASQQLACSICVTVNIGIDRADISKNHWTYFYDDDIIFTRLSFPHMQSPHNVPEGYGSCQAEIYFSNKYKPVDRPINDFIKPVINDLIRCGLLSKKDKILFSEARIIPYANVIFDLDRSTNLAIVHKYLDDIGIRYCGRYGDWGYHWTDGSFMSGEKAAQKAQDDCVILK